MVRERLERFPAVAILGPRQCGKTTLARSFPGEYFDLEQESDRLRLDLDWKKAGNREVSGNPPWVSNTFDHSDSYFWVTVGRFREAAPLSGRRRVGYGLFKEDKKKEKEDKRQWNLHTGFEG